MNSSVQKDLLQLLSKLSSILKKKSIPVIQLKELSNHTVHNAALFEDKDAISVTVFVYALSKIIERTTNNLNRQQCATLVESAYRLLKRNKIVAFRSQLRKLYSFLSSQDAKISLYVGDVLNHAQIKKGCKICEHGLSCAKSAQLLNISQWELMQYLGKTTIVETRERATDVRARLAYARMVFS